MISGPALPEAAAQTVTMLLTQSIGSNVPTKHAAPLELGMILLYQQSLSAEVVGWLALMLVGYGHFKTGWHAACLNSSRNPRSWQWTSKRSRDGASVVRGGFFLACASNQLQS